MLGKSAARYFFGETSVPRIPSDAGLQVEDCDRRGFRFSVLKGELPRGIEYNFGPGIGLTRGSDRVIVKFNLELEHFIGSLF